MEAIGLLVTLEARRGKEADAEAFLKSAQPLALDEKGTLKWYAIKLGPGKFGIFDTFPNEGGRNAHLSGEIAKALGARANELLAVPPQIEKSRSLQARPSKAKCEVSRPSEERKENQVSQTASSIKQQKYDAGVARVDMKLEVDIIPVSDVERSKVFYQRLGWRL